MEDINLHFTGDFHAITSANNLISACIDNHLYQGNLLNIDEKRIIWKRCVDLNDRALREVTVGESSEKEITLSLLRATERPDPLSDLGQHNFTYVILPHGELSYGDINNEALIFNNPLVRAEALTVPECWLADGRLVLQSVKKAENSSHTNPAR